MTNYNPDLHVMSLRYSVQPDERFSYDNPPPIRFESQEARFHLDAGILTCEMKIHCADVDTARKAVEPILRAWETDTDLRQTRGQLRFKFDRPEIIDRSPAPLGTVSGVAAVIVGEAMISATGSVSFHLTSTAYPEPPPEFFRLNPDAESLLQRYYGYLDRREPLQAMAYFCLTLLTANSGGLDKAEAKYRVHRDVLRKISELSSTRGNRLNARKADAVQPLSGAESAWLEAAVRMLIRRLADTRPFSGLPLITMTNLPTL
jgi:hypothetical protein